MRRISAGMVAENSTICRPGGDFSRIQLDVVDETHAEHLVGLVEHQRGQALQVERAAMQVIDHAARGADDHVGAAAQAAELGPVGLAAVDGQHVEAGQVLRVARGTPRPPGSPAPASGSGPGPGGRTSARSSRARIGRAKAAVLPVPVWAWPTRSRPASRGGMVWRLDGGWGLVTHVRQRLQQGFRQGEVGEGNGGDFGRHDGLGGRRGRARIVP